MSSKLRGVRAAGSDVKSTEHQPSAPTKNRTPQSVGKKKCPINAKPNCPVLLDKLDQMMGEILDALAIKTSELQKHNAYCKMISDGLNAEITAAQSQLAVWNVE